MLRRFFANQEKKTALKLVESAAAWNRICRKVSEICGEALHNPEIGSTDIGVILDRVDKQLFSLRNENADLCRALGRRERALERRVRKTSQAVFSLRNDTARFLIRAQGPGSFVAPQAPAGVPADPQASLYYHRALDQVGYQARQRKDDLDQELASVWHDLQPVIERAREYFPPE